MPAHTIRHPLSTERVGAPEIVEGIDDRGIAHGIMGLGPPTPTTPQTPAFYETFSGPVTDDGLRFSLRNMSLTFKYLEDGRLRGHNQGWNYETAIVLRRIN